MKVLITGGAGFIGSHLCDSRVLLGDEVTILDNFSTGSKKNIEHLNYSANLVDGDIVNKKLVMNLVEKSDLVFHLAAAVGVKTILNKPIESIITNFIGSEVVMNACSKLGKKIVIASTSEIYGKNTKQPLSEEDDRVMGAPQKLRWSYADSKALEESMAHALFLANELKVITVRFFNVVGPRQSASYGMVVPRFVQSALENKPLKIFGDGKQMRVFCHVFDAVKAINLLSYKEEAIGQVFNIGGTEEISIEALAKLIILELNSKSKIIFEEYSKFYGEGFEDMRRRVPNLEKLNKLTGWKPRLDLRATIKNIVEEMN